MVVYYSIVYIYELFDGVTANISPNITTQLAPWKVSIITMKFYTPIFDPFRIVYCHVRHTIIPCIKRILIALLSYVSVINIAKYTSINIKVYFLIFFSPSNFQVYHSQEECTSFHWYASVSLILKALKNTVCIKSCLQQQQGLDSSASSFSGY